MQTAVDRAQQPGHVRGEIRVGVREAGPAVDELEIEPTPPRRRGAGDHGPQRPPGPSAVIAAQKQRQRRALPRIAGRVRHAGGEAMAGVGEADPLERGAAAAPDRRPARATVARPLDPTRAAPVHRRFRSRRNVEAVPRINERHVLDASGRPARGRRRRPHKPQRRRPDDRKRSRRRCEKQHRAQNNRRTHAHLSS